MKNPILSLSVSAVLFLQVACGTSEMQENTVKKVTGAAITGEGDQTKKTVPGDDSGHPGVAVCYAPAVPVAQPKTEIKAEAVTEAVNTELFGEGRIGGIKVMDMTIPDIARFENLNFATNEIDSTLADAYVNPGQVVEKTHKKFEDASELYKLIGELKEAPLGETCQVYGSGLHIDIMVAAKSIRVYPNCGQTKRIEGVKFLSAGQYLKLWELFSKVYDSAK